MKQATFGQIAMMILILTTVLLVVFVIDGQMNQARANVAQIMSCDRGAIATVVEAADRASGCFVDEQCSQALPIGVYCPPGYETITHDDKTITCMPHRATRWTKIDLAACPENTYCCIQTGGPVLHEIEGDSRTLMCNEQSAPDCLGKEIGYVFEKRASEHTGDWEPEDTLIEVTCQPVSQGSTRCHVRACETLGVTC